MSTTDKREDGDALGAEAAAWALRVHAAGARDEDWLALEAWLAVSPEHQQAYERAERVWLAFDDPALARLAADPSRPQAPLIARSPDRRRPAWIVPAGLAASFVAILAIGAMLVSRWSAPPAQAYSTAAGESRLIRLADGSTIWLGGASRLTARVGRGHRDVALDSGEATFEVAKDPAHPFTVTVADRTVTVVGTRFDISKAEDELRVTVASGVVEVAGSAGQDRFRLTPGWQLTHRVGAEASSAALVDPADAFAWTKGYLVYRDRPLTAVAADLSRDFPTPVRVEGAAASLRFSGVLVLDNEDAVVRRLGEFLAVRVVRDPGAIVLRPR